METENLSDEKLQPTTPATVSEILRQPGRRTLVQIAADLEADTDWEARQNAKCDAKEREERAERIKANLDGFERHTGSLYKGCTVKGFERFGTEKERAKQSELVALMGKYGRELADNARSGVGIVLFGPPGTGKDHMVCALGQYAIRCGLSVGFWYGLKLFAANRDRIGAGGAELPFLARFESPDILILSDPIPPRDELSNAQASLLANIADARNRKQRPTWVTINAKSDDDLRDLVGAQVASRLKQNAIVYHCNWPDYRERRKAQ